jgi:hypothetical protein
MVCTQLTTYLPDELEAQAQMQLKLRPKTLDQAGHLIVEQSADLGSPITSAATFEELGLYYILFIVNFSGKNHCWMQSTSMDLPNHLEFRLKLFQLF